MVHPIGVENTESDKKEHKHICKKLPFFEHENNPHIVMAFSLYEKALRFQLMGEVKLALDYYLVLVTYIGTDPYIWIRMAECGLELLFKDFKSWMQSDTLPSNPIWVDPSSKKGFYILNDRDTTITETNGATIVNVESYINTAMVLLIPSRDLELKMKVKSLAAFIALKRGRFGTAVGHANEILEVNEGIPDSLKFQAFIIRMECYLNQGNFREILVNLDSNASYIKKTDQWTLWQIKCYTLVGAFEEAIKLVEEKRKHHNSKELFIISAYLYFKTKRESEFLQLLSM